MSVEMMYVRIWATKSRELISSKTGKKFKKPSRAQAFDQPRVIHPFTTPHYSVHHCCVVVVILSQNEKFFTRQDPVWSLGSPDLHGADLLNTSST